MLQVNQVLKKVPFFQTLGKESMDFIVDRLKFHSFENGVDVVKIGDPGDTMFIVVAGEVDVLIKGADGGESKVAVIGPGNYFGEMALMTGEPRSATIRTNRECEMFSLHKDDFDIILEKYPSISLSLGKIMSQRLRQTLAKASELSKGNAAEISGLTGSLEKKNIMDLFVFCEENSISGELHIDNVDKQARIIYEKGNMMNVFLGGRSGTEALDEILSWTSGNFEVRQKKLSMERGNGEEVPVATVPVTKNEIVVIHNSLVVQKVIERSLSNRNWLITAVKTVAGGGNALNEHVFAVILDVKLPDGKASDFIERHAKSGIYFLVMTLAGQAQAYHELKRTNDKVIIIENNDIPMLVKHLEELRNA
jgi:CRP-like cAMP-binding protein